VVELLLFDEVADAVTSLVPADLGEVRCRAHRYGIKVWFGSDTPSKEVRRSAHRPMESGTYPTAAKRGSDEASFAAPVPKGEIPKEHYEAQVMGAGAMDEAKVQVLEIGFHAEHPDEARNQAMLEQLLADERRWRRVLGAEAEAGTFLGRRDDWRRVSELWPDPDLSDPTIALEIAARLTDYITVLEPARRRTASR